LLSDTILVLNQENFRVHNTGSFLAALGSNISSLQLSDCIDRIAVIRLVRHRALVMFVRALSANGSRENIPGVRKANASILTVFSPDIR
jgi:hypothetical protein